MSVHESLPARAVVGPSRFTHLGRHLGFLQALLSCSAAPPRSCLLLGSGPVEPMLVAQLLANAVDHGRVEVHAVDHDRQVIRLLGELHTERRASLLELGRVCCDDFDSRPDAAPENTNFTSRLADSFTELEGNGFDSLFAVDGDCLFVAPTPTVDLRFTHAPASEFLSSNPSARFDAAYLGLLLANMRKVDRSTPREVLLALRPLLPNGLLGVGSSLSPVYGAGQDLRDLGEAGFEPCSVALENLVLSSGQLYGDYGIVAAPDLGLAPAVRPRVPICSTAANWESLSVVSGSSAEHVTAMIDGAMSGGRLVVSAHREPAETWSISSVEIAEAVGFLTEGRRLWFSPLELRRRQR